MIVKNEEQHLPGCLDSISDLVDEIIIVDTGSTDSTLAIAASYKAQIYHYKWSDDFSAAKNFAFAQATSDYILWLDADDCFRESDREKFLRLKETLPPEVDSVIMDYILAVDAAGNPAAISRRNRLVRRSKGYQWRLPVHEYLEVLDGMVLRSDIAVTHVRTDGHSERNLQIIEKCITQGAQLTGHLLFMYASELADLGRDEEAAIHFESYLKEPTVYREQRILACARLSDCYSRLGLKQKRLEALLRSFQYDAPRAEICCSLGSYFEQEEEWMSAIYWYLQTLAAAEGSRTLEIENRTLITWVPHSRLSICYAKLGQLKTAFLHNEKALEYLPNEPFLVENRRILEKAMQVSSK